MRAGTLYGLGLGPGESALITLKARRILEAGPVVAYPAPLQGESLARRIAADHLPPDAVEMPLRLDIGSTHDLGPSYDRLSQELATVLRDGRDVALLCTGDPMLYGSFVYFYRRLRENFACRIVPGVSAINACAAEAGTPLALGDGKLAVLPATLAEDALQAVLTGGHGAAVVKIGRHAAKLQRALAATGRLATALYVARAGHTDQVVAPFADTAPGDVPYFATVIVPPGEAAHDG